jgi:hypothetical protein
MKSVMVVLSAFTLTLFTSCYVGVRSGPPQPYRQRGWHRQRERRETKVIIQGSTGINHIGSLEPSLYFVAINN